MSSLSWIRNCDPRRSAKLLYLLFNLLIIKEIIVDQLKPKLEKTPMVKLNKLRCFLTIINASGLLYTVVLGLEHIINFYFTYAFFCDTVIQCLCLDKLLSNTHYC